MTSTVCTNFKLRLVISLHVIECIIIANYGNKFYLQHEVRHFNLAILINPTATSGEKSYTYIAISRTFLYFVILRPSFCRLRSYTSLGLTVILPIAFRSPYNIISVIRLSDVRESLVPGSLSAVSPVTSSEFYSYAPLSRFASQCARSSWWLVQTTYQTNIY